MEGMDRGMEKGSKRQKEGQVECWTEGAMKVWKEG